jgi:triosephosphate isomerase
VMWDQEHAVVLAGVHGERQRHAREDDDVVQWNQEKSTHQDFTFVRCLQEIS